MKINGFLLNKSKYTKGLLSFHFTWKTWSLLFIQIWSSVIEFFQHLELWDLRQKFSVSSRSAVRSRDLSRLQFSSSWVLKSSGTWADILKEIALIKLMDKIFLYINIRSHSVSLLIMQSMIKLWEISKK